MSQTPKAVLEAKPENPGRLTLIGADGMPQLRLPLTPLKPEELSGLVNELSSRGFEVELCETDVEAEPAALGAQAALHRLGLHPPYSALDAAIALDPGLRDGAAH